MAKAHRVGVGHEHRCLQRLAERIEPGFGRPVGHDVEQRQADAAAADGDDVDQPSGLRGQPGHAAHHRVAKGRRHVRLAAPGGVEELLDQERVAVGPAEQVLDQAGRLGMSGPHRDERGGLGSPEQGDRDFLDRRHPTQFGDPSLQPRVGGELVTRREHEDDGHVGEVAHEVVDQVEGGGIGPVEVLDDGDDDASVGSGGEPVEQAEHGLEQRTVTPRIGARGGVAAAHGELGQKGGERSPHQGRAGLAPRSRCGRDAACADRFDDRCVGVGGVLELNAVTDEPGGADRVGDVPATARRAVVLPTPASPLTSSTARRTVGALVRSPSGT